MAYNYFPGDGRLFEGDPVDPDTKVNTQQFGPNPKGRRKVMVGDEPYEVQFQADPLNTAEMGYAGTYNAPVQLPMLAPAGQLRENVLSRQLKSVDIPQGYTPDDWDDMKTVYPGEGGNNLYDDLARDRRIDKPVVMYNPREDQYFEGPGWELEILPHETWLGDGNHRVATAGKHWPDMEVPLEWDENHYMGSNHDPFWDE